MDKKDERWSFVPINCHAQLMAVHGDTTQVDETGKRVPFRMGGPPIALTPTVTVGAFAAHDLGFKNGGFTKLQQRLHEFSINSRVRRVPRVCLCADDGGLVVWAVAVRCSTCCIFVAV